MENKKFIIVVPITDKFIFKNYSETVSKFVDAEFLQVEEGVPLITTEEEVEASKPGLIKLLDNLSFTQGNIFISCFGDIFFDEFTEKYPSFKFYAPGAQTLTAAEKLGEKYVILTLGDGLNTVLRDELSGIHEKLNGNKNLLHEIEGLGGNYAEVERNMPVSILKYCEKGIKNFVFGCTGFVHFKEFAEKKARADGFQIRVFEPHYVIFDLLKSG